MEINEQVVREIVNSRSVIMEYQPIINVNSRRIIGVEALGRGIYEGERILPYYMFHHAKACGINIELDRICHEAAVEEFSRKLTIPMLFLNLENDVIANPQEELSRIGKLAELYGLKPANIVLEVNERSIVETGALYDFVTESHEAGFLVCFDDVGSAQKDFHRISTIKPDAVKIDRFIIQRIEESISSQEVLRTIASISKEAGAFVIAEGVETIREAVTCLLEGVDCFQGYYFTDPVGAEKIAKLDFSNRLDETVQELNSSIRQKRVLEMNSRSAQLRLAMDLVEALSEKKSCEYEDELLRFVTEHGEVECAFLIDGNGVQISDTIMLAEVFENRRSMLFAPAVKGDRHEIKNYFYAVNEGLEDPFLTEQYISGATGNSCRTVSSKFYDENGNPVILCIDIKQEKGLKA